MNDLTIRDIKDAIQDLKGIRQQAIADRAWASVRDSIAQTREFQAELAARKAAKLSG